MPVGSASAVRVIRRCVRSRFSRGPTWSGATAMADRLIAVLHAAHQTPVSRFRQRSWTGRRSGSNLGAMSEYDVAIIGGGAAGLSAALVLSRARRRVLVVDAGAPRNAPAPHMHGFLSRDGLAPERTARRSAGTRCTATAARSSTAPSPSSSATAPRASGCCSQTGDGSRPGGCWSRPGLRDELPDIPGLRERWARDVLHCPYCHGYEVRDRQLGVLGGNAGRGPLRPDRAPVDATISSTSRADRPAYRRRPRPARRPRHRRRRGRPSRRWSSRRRHCAACG